jgi:hypothetical protein
MSDPNLDARGRALAEQIQEELASHGFGDKMTARYDPSLQCVLVGPVVLDADRQHEVYYPIGLEMTSIVDDVLRRAADGARES